MVSILPASEHQCGELPGLIAKVQRKKNSNGTRTVLDVSTFQVLPLLSRVACSAVSDGEVIVSANFDTASNRR